MLSDDYLEIDDPVGLFVVCRRCGSSVYYGRLTESGYGMEIHDQFHARFRQVARNADTLNVIG